MSENRNIILSVKDLEVKFKVRDRILTAIRNISMDFEEGRKLVETLVNQETSQPDDDFSF